MPPGSTQGIILTCLHCFENFNEIESILWCRHPCLIPLNNTYRNPNPELRMLTRTSRTAPKLRTWHIPRSRKTTSYGFPLFYDISSCICIQHTVPSSTASQLHHKGQSASIDLISEYTAYLRATVTDAMYMSNLDLMRVADA